MSASDLLWIGEASGSKIRENDGGIGIMFGGRGGTRSSKEAGRKFSKVLFRVCWRLYPVLPGG